MAKRNKQSKREKRAHFRSQEQPKAEQLEPQNKIWKRVGLFNKYEDALAHKEKVLSSIEDPSELEIKIKRCGPDGTQFQVKLWTAPTLRYNIKRNKKRKQR